MIHEQEIEKQSANEALQCSSCNYNAAKQLSVSRAPGHSAYFDGLVRPFGQLRMWHVAAAAGRDTIGLPEDLAKSVYSRHYCGCCGGINAEV